MSNNNLTPDNSSSVDSTNNITSPLHERLDIASFDTNSLNPSFDTPDTFDTLNNNLQNDIDNNPSFTSQPVFQYDVEKEIIDDGNKIEVTETKNGITTHYTINKSKKYNKLTPLTSLALFGVPSNPLNLFELLQKDFEPFTGTYSTGELNNLIDRVNEHVFYHEKNNAGESAERTNNDTSKRSINRSSIKRKKPNKKYIDDINDDDLFDTSENISELRDVLTDEEIKDVKKAEKQLIPLIESEPFYKKIESKLSNLFSSNNKQSTHNSSDDETDKEEVNKLLDDIGSYGSSASESQTTVTALTNQEETDESSSSLTSLNNNNNLLQEEKDKSATPTPASPASATSLNNNNNNLLQEEKDESSTPTSALASSASSTSLNNNNNNLLQDNSNSTINSSNNVNSSSNVKEDEQFSNLENVPIPNKIELGSRKSKRRDKTAINGGRRSRRTRRR